MYKLSRSLTGFDFCADFIKDIYTHNCISIVIVDIYTIQLHGITFL